MNDLSKPYEKQPFHPMFISIYILLICNAYSNIINIINRWPQEKYLKMYSEF